MAVRKEMTKAKFNGLLKFISRFRDDLHRCYTSDDLYFRIYKAVYDTWLHMQTMLADVKYNAEVTNRLEELSTLESLIDEKYEPIRQLTWSEIQLMQRIISLYDSYEWRREHLYRTTTFFDNQFNNNTELARRLGDMGFDMSWFSVLIFVYFYNEKVNEAKKEVNVG
jgi:hypothetical protein